jgi:hypothetical protein
MALALSCDLTRVISYAFTTEESETIFYKLGATAQYHDGITHRAAEGNNREVMVKAMAFQMGRLAKLVERFASTPEGEGSLLDNSLIYACSAVSDPVKHRTDEVPVVLAGRAGGRLKTGIHHRSTTNEASTKVQLTILNALGVPRKEFGVGVNRVSDTLGGIEA